MVAGSAPDSWTIPHVRQVHCFKISIVNQHNSQRSTLSPRMISEDSLKFRQRNEKREIPALRLVCASFFVRRSDWRYMVDARLFSVCTSFGLSKTQIARRAAAEPAARFIPGELVKIASAFLRE